MRRLLPLVLAGALALGACGGGDDTTAEAGGGPSSAPGPTAQPADVAPERIISLSPTATEMLFAIGAGDHVVAVDDQSDYPESVPTTDLSGYEPNVEAIAGYEPDLVVASDNAIEAELGTLGIDLLTLPAATTLDETYAQIEQLGDVTGNAQRAAALVEQMQADIEQILAAVPAAEQPPTYYHELDDTYYSVSRNSFIGQLYELAGLRSIGDEADTDGSGYPQLSAEYIIESDPDLVFLADTECCQQSADTVTARPGWDQLTAVREGRVVELSDDVASRWGPRVVDLLRVIVDARSSLADAA